jgi:hypothetical protein
MRAVLKHRLALQQLSGELVQALEELVSGINTPPIYVGPVALAGTVSGTTGRTDVEALRERLAKSADAKQISGGPDFHQLEPVGVVAAPH